jgi:hypothetical protein
MQNSTLAQQFAAKHSKGVVNAAIWTVRIVRWSATAIMAAAMASNYHHQVQYLETHVDWLTAHIAPIALDLLTVLCARILASVVMHVVSKKAAIRALWFPVLASAALSAAAPGDLISKLVFAGMVGLIPIAEYVASHVKIDFKALEAAEVENAPAVETVITDAERERRSAIARKAAATRKRNQAAKVKTTRSPRAPKAAKVPDEIDQIEALFDVAPVSPAPAGR